MTTSPFPIREVVLRWRSGEEPMGTKQKFWCQADDGLRFLFKYAREGTGEDWAEKVASEIAAVMQVPHAQVDLARFNGHRGTLTLDFTEPDSGVVLVHGNELLQEGRPDYPADAAYRASQHTVGAVLDVLGQPFVYPPVQAQSIAGVSSAADWFVGYLVLDALIGNTDRHHENWGVLERVGSRERYVSLAPSYDHASSLGRELRDEERSARLAGQDRRRTVASYARRTRSALYRSPTDTKPMSPIDASREAMCLALEAGRTWLRRIEVIDDATLTSILERLPSELVSDASKRFAFALVSENRRVLLEGQEAST